MTSARKYRSLSLLAGALIIVVSGCGGDDQSPQAPTQVEESPQPDDGGNTDDQNDRDDN